MVKLSEDEIKHQLQRMDPYKFEELVAEIWELQGYQTTVLKGSGDRGIDVEATKQLPVPQKVLIQAKRYEEGNKVGAEEARKYATLYQQEPDADMVIIVTSSTLTNEAQKICTEQNIKSIDINKLSNLIDDNIIELQQFFIPTLDNEEVKTNGVTDEKIVLDDHWKTEISNYLVQAIMSDEKFGERGHVHIRWEPSKGPNEGERYTIDAIYKKRGLIFKKFGLMISLNHQVNRKGVG